MIGKLMACALPAALLAAALAAAAPSPVRASDAFPKATRAGPPRFDEQDRLAEAVANPARAAENRARDPWRHPAESLAFWGLRPGDNIIELSPGGGYWTEILAPFAEATGGSFVGTGADLDDPATPERARKARADYADRYKVKTAGLGKLSGPLAPAGSVDFILTGRNIHNWVWQGSLDKILADAYAALKPGGVLAVEEHRADPRPMVKDAEDGYMSEAYVIAAVEKAGFRLDARSEVNANPKDSKDHPFGVWTLPPVRQSAPRGQPDDPRFDRSRYEAIGESDRMTLRFRKPA